MLFTFIFKMNNPNSSEISDLKLFVKETNSWVDGILDSLCWTREYIIQKEVNLPCPVNPEHSVPSKSLEEHGRSCSLLSRGYTKEELEMEHSSKIFYEKALNVLSIDLDDATIRTILSTTNDPVPADLPLTMRRTITDLTPAQRLKIYDYCIEISRSSNLKNRIAEEDLSSLEFGKRNEKPQSKLELLAKMRDMKRRRQSYRNKNTHTGKKNHMEVIRDVLNNQMELLGKMWEDERLEKEKLQRQAERKERESRTWSPGSQNKTKGSDVDRNSDEKHHRSRRQRDRSRSKDPKRDRSKGHKRDRSKSNECKRDRSKSGDRKRDRSKSGDCKRDRSKSGDHKRDRSKSGDLKRDRSKSNDRKRDRSKSNDRKRDRSKSGDRKRDHGKSKRHKKSKHRKHGRSRSKDRKSNASESRDQSTDLAVDTADHDRTRDEGDGARKNEDTDNNRDPDHCQDDQSRETNNELNRVNNPDGGSQTAHLKTDHDQCPEEIEQNVDLM